MAQLNILKINLPLFFLLCVGCETPTDVYVFHVPGCKGEKPVVNLKDKNCRLKIKEEKAIACNTSFSKYESQIQDIKIQFLMNPDQTGTCQVYAAINYPQSGISERTKTIYYEVVSQSIRSCIDDQALVLKEEYRVDDEESFNSLCERK